MLPAYYFGLADIGLLVLFLVPATRKVGFLLSICYYSAALATRLTIKESPAEPLLILALLFTAMFLTNREMFVRGSS